MLALLAPGQGSQTPGLLSPWLADASARQQVARWSSLAGLDLETLGTSGTAEQVRDTAVAQPLLTAVALLSGRAVLGGSDPDLVCGHSVGELAALALAGVLDDDVAVSLAAGRGRAMAAAAALAPTGMAAVLGGERAGVLKAADRFGLELATVNVAGQLVLGGPVALLDQLAAQPPTGSRVRRLETAGAFHTRAMAPAAEEFARLVAAVAPRPPRCRVIANADGAVVDDPSELMSRLVGQLTRPVEFASCLDTLATSAPDLVVELAPAGTLVALVKRALPGTAVVAVKTPADARLTVPA